MTVVKRAWIPLAILVLVAIAGFAVHRLHGVFGPAGTVADINYLDVDAAPQRVDGMRLPWTYSVATTAPAVSVNVVAQGDGETIGCRITVNGAIKAQRTVAGIHPQTFCLVKSA